MGIHYSLAPAARTVPIPASIRAGPRRTPVLPYAPTISDAPIPGFDTTVWFGLFAPAGTSRTAVDKINGKMNAGRAQELRQARYRAGGRTSGCSCRKSEIRDSKVGRRRAREEYSPRAVSQPFRETIGMPNPKRQMHLGIFVLGTGNHSAGSRYEGASTSNCSWPVLQSIARIAERGKLDLFFVSDGLATEAAGDHPSFVSRFEPTILIAALREVTRHIGLVAN